MLKVNLSCEPNEGWPAWVLWPILYLFGTFIKVNQCSSNTPIHKAYRAGRVLQIPAYQNAPLLHPSKANLPSKEWPLVIFSHALGGSRTAYSQFCSKVAASGRVVIALEHRDGTGTIALPSSWNPRNDENMFYLREDHI